MSYDNFRGHYSDETAREMDFLVTEIKDNISSFQNRPGGSAKIVLHLLKEINDKSILLKSL